MNLVKKKKQTRRFFIKSTVIGLVAGLAVIWDSMITTQVKINSRKKIVLPFLGNKEVSFQDDFVIINSSNGETNVFFFFFTHLGCKINEHTNSQLLCPCHGSSFDFNGNVIKGPAVKPLKKVNFEIDIISNQIIIKT